MRMISDDALEVHFSLRLCEKVAADHARLFPDASLVRASARESRSATQVAPLEISDS